MLLENRWAICVCRFNRLMHVWKYAWTLCTEYILTSVCKPFLSTIHDKSFLTINLFICSFTIYTGISVEQFNNKCFFASSTRGKPLIDFPTFCQYRSKKTVQRVTRDQMSQPPCVRSGWGVKNGNEAAMDLQRDASQGILLRERFLNSSRATRKKNQGYQS